MDGSLVEPSDQNFTLAHSHNDCAPDPAETEAHLFRFWVNGVLLNTVGALGLVGNALSVAVLSRPRGIRARCGINCLLIGLARADSLLIVTSVLLFGLPALYPYGGWLPTYYYVIYPHAALFLFPASMILQTASVYLTVAVSLERYVAVCRPLRARALCTPGRARALSIAVVIFAIVYNIPRFFEGKVLSNFDHSFNATVYCPWVTDLRVNPLYISVYVHWTYFVCMYALPFGALAALNAAIYRRVVKANRERRRLSRLQRREFGLATMLLAVVAVFFICNLLPLACNVAEVLSIGDNMPSALIQTSNLLVTVNSSVNFAVYVAFGGNFRRIFVTIFCGKVRTLTGSKRDVELDPDGGVSATGDDSIGASNGGSTRFHNASTRSSQLPASELQNQYQMTTV